MVPRLDFDPKAHCSGELEVLTRRLWRLQANWTSNTPVAREVQQLIIPEARMVKSLLLPGGRWLLVIAYSPFVVTAIDLDFPDRVARTIIESGDPDLTNRFFPVPQYFEYNSFTGPRYGLLFSSYLHRPSSG